MKHHLLLMMFTLVCTGCTHTILARRLVRAPNLQSTPSLKFGATTDVFTAVSVTARTPEILLKATVVEPGDWHLVYNDSQQKSENAFVAEVQMSFKKPEVFIVEPKGTVILLHGFGLQKEQMLHWAVSLAQQGFRCVMVDLRGHGGSSGKWVGFGAFEVEDMRSVLDALIARRLVPGKVGVIGVSLGASVAIQWAGADPRIATVVAIEPFADPQSAIGTMVQQFPPFRRLLWWVPESTIQQAIQGAPGEAGFKWAEVDVPKAAMAVKGPILFIHGADDKMVPPDHSQRLSAGSPIGSRLLILPGEDHISLAIRLQPIDVVVHDWFKQNLAENPPSK
ncbi:alpha/beta hydrolase [Geothrix fuzhouensis]|uniref:alpha/beta hydrolase n=1 Tax=Geothrix fuzhouensis TaxID=2966451 RepID=UPI00214910F3|nr:lysophospholipase [Geothrix fuzhouensis]